MHWKPHAKFFIELTDALDYLHSPHTQRSYIHVDLKPQKIFQAVALQIKLGDLGSAAIAKLTGASSLKITDEDNIQHTPYYAAPEYSKKPTTKKRKSMGVYSFGLIGYEIITRKVVFSNTRVSEDVMIQLIFEQEQKPNEKEIDNVKIFLKDSTDIEIFIGLEAIVKEC